MTFHFYNCQTGHPHRVLVHLSGTFYSSFYRAPFCLFQMWQVFLHLWNQLFYTPDSWLPVSVTHTDITHVHTPYLGRLCPYKPDFCPKHKFYWVASSPRRSFWTLSGDQLVMDVSPANLSHFGMLGDILASFWHSSPSPSAIRTYLLSTWSHARHSSCYITWLEVFGLESRQGRFSHPMLE